MLLAETKQNMTTLVTGSNLLGSYVTNELVEAGENVVLFDVAPQVENISRVVKNVNAVKIEKGDVLNWPDLLKVFKEQKIDRIIHTAAVQTRGKPHYHSFRVNVEGTLNLLELARINDVQNFVYFSSQTLYKRFVGRVPQNPIEEDASIKLITERPVDNYSIAKLTAECLGLSYFEYYGMNFKVLRFAAVFGPWTGSFGASIADRIDYWIRTSLQGKAVNETSLRFKGSQLVYVKDAARATVLASNLQPRSNYRVFNIAMDDISTYEEIARTIEKIIPGSRISPGYASDAAEVLAPRFSVKLAREELGFETKYSLETALRDQTSIARTDLKDHLPK